eukprot:Tamp_28042.p1 GENE.Tamp_28042~~Tamp_28042.p1  ORF type:complete len:125 (+),score=4.37 Tamp_28042:134-508(+)
MPSPDSTYVCTCVPARLPRSSNAWEKSAAIPLMARRPNTRARWTCDKEDYEDGSSFSQCKMPDPNRIHRQRHLVYPQLMPGGFYVNGKTYDSERSNALPLVRGLLEPWTHGTSGWKFQQMEYGS